MTQIDAGAEVDIVWRDQEVTIRIPLDGEISQDWARRYPRLAERKGIAARAENAPGRAWIVVTLPASADTSEVLETLQAASDLVASADAVEETSAEHERQIVTAVREWWADHRD
jgi:hypothetical protein